MKKLIFTTIIIIILFMGINSVKSESIKVPSNAIRLRVLANSNSDYDQLVKFAVSNKVQKQLYELLKDTESIDEARLIINSSLALLDEEINKTLREEKYTLGHSINYGLNYFPEKEYNGVTYDEGYYESLLVTLGSGKGDNWWCVLFPPLCLIEAEESSEVEYKFFVQELIDKYF